MAEHLNFCYTPLFFSFISEFQVNVILFNYLFTCVGVFLRRNTL